MWIVFSVIVLGAMILDLGVFHRKAHEVKMKEALAWSAVWVSLAFVFMGVVYVWRGPDKAMEFFAGYLIEQSLSVDNLFVFLLIFSYFRVHPAHQHRVLFWGIVGAVVMRAAFIVAGVALIQKFHWTIYIFGLILVASGVKMALEKDKEIHPEKNPVLKIFKRFFKVAEHFEGEKFFVKHGGVLHATPLFVVLLLVETTDVIFAVDSIPAVLAVTQDPFIVYTSNVFAILGLRSLYFALAGIMRLFHYLHYGLSVILVFVGVKMLLSHFYAISTAAALVFIASVLALSITASAIWPKKIA